MSHEPRESEYARRVDPALWRKLFGYTRPYRKEVALFLFFGGVVALVDTAFPLITRSLVDDIADEGAEVRLLPFAAAYLALTLVLSVCVWRFIRLGGRIRTRVSHDIRRAGFANLQELSFSFYDRRPVGWLMARMTSDCERLANIMAWGVLDLVWGSTLMLATSITMFILDARLALIVLLTVPALAWISLVFQKRILLSARGVRKTNSRLTAAYNESIMGVRTTKAFAREGDNLEEFSALSGEMYAASRRNQLQNALFLPAVMTLASVATGLALALGGAEVAAGAISVGTLVAFLAYAAHFFEPVQELAQWFAELQMAQASAERVMGLIEEEPAIADSPEVQAALREHAGERPSGVASDGGREDFARIAFRAVSFTYAEGKRVLDGFDLEVEAGQTIALVGPTGGGKSTIVALLSRFYEPTQGEVLFDGVDYRERSLHWLQSKLGIVLQTPHLFSGTVRENIRYGALQATDTEVEDAARMAGAHAFVTELEKGYNTEVGEGGALLSTGQRQLVSFARAVLARPQILIMDEATSSVDTETERRIQEGLTRVLEGRTSFVIAHRLSTIRNADRILVVEGGRIVEDGSHGELLARRGHYHELYTRQSLRESAFAEEAWSGGEPDPAPAT